MDQRILAFWTWFTAFADELPDDNPPDGMLNDLVEQLHAIDARVFFELSINTDEKALVLTACGDADAFPIVDEIVATAPQLEGWTFHALKPPLGFEFTFQNNGIVVRADQLWFVPLTSQEHPTACGIRLGVPQANELFGAQTVDAAYTILETGIGERSCCTDIHFVEVGDLPDDPESEGYLELPRLAEYLAWRKYGQLKVDGDGA